MAFFTYILRSALTGRFYIGHAEDLARPRGRFQNFAAVKSLYQSYRSLY